MSFVLLLQGYGLKRKRFAPAPRGAIHPAKRGRVRALAPMKAVAVATEPKRGTGRVLTTLASDAIVY
jgi:hypothetical protein